MNINFEQRTRHCVKSGGENQHVKVILRAVGDQACWRNALDWVIFDAHEVNVCAVESFIIMGVNANAFAPEHLVRTQQLGSLRVGHGASNLVADKLCGDLVGVEIAASITKAAAETESTLLPACFKPLRLTRLIKVENRCLPAGLMGAEPSKHLFIQHSEVVVMLFDFLDIAFVYRAIVGRNGVIRRSLEDR